MMLDATVTQAELARIIDDTRLEPEATRHLTYRSHLNGVHDE
jgi:hypothetical protein